MLFFTSTRLKICSNQVCNSCKNSKDLVRILPRTPWNVAIYVSKQVLTYILSHFNTGCPQGTYGRKCAFNCGLFCLDGTCDPISGSCLQPQCAEGWSGPKCDVGKHYQQFNLSLAVYRKKYKVYILWFYIRWKLNLFLLIFWG